MIFQQSYPPSPLRSASADSKLPTTQGTSLLSPRTVPMFPRKELQTRPSCSVSASVPRKRSWRFVSSFESFWVERILRQSLHLKAENLMWRAPSGPTTQKVVSVASPDLSLSASVQTGENQLSDALGISLKVLGGV